MTNFEKLPLSVVIITKNEEKNLGRCLESVTWAAETLVLDSGSEDQTQALAQRMGARVVQEPWRGFGAQKAFAAQLARYDWVLSLDADERVPEALAREIRARLPQLDSQTAYSFPRRSFFLGRWIQYGGWYPDRQVRLFNRAFSNWDESPIHEQVRSEKRGEFDSALEHFVFADLAHQISTNNRYSGLLALRDVQKGKRFRVWKLVIKPGVKFIENYIFKRGFLDALPGFIIAVNSAHSTFLRWAKIREIEMRREEK